MTMFRWMRQPHGSLSGARRHVHLASQLNCKEMSGAGLTAWVSGGGIRQGAASRQMPSPAETGS